MIRIRYILFLIVVAVLTGCDGFGSGCEPDIRWGTLANPGFESHRIKTTLFFSGQARDGSSPYSKSAQYAGDVPYDHGGTPPDLPVSYVECDPVYNMQLYTAHPEDERHLNWSTDPANRTFAVNQMVQAGINVVSMSSWGASTELCGGYWQWWAPMQTSPQSHDELFEAVGDSLLIMPFIESHSNWHFRDEFPRTESGQVAPGAVLQIVDLIDRYLLNSEHPEWAQRWAQVYDREGVPRYAVVIIHATSKRLGADDHLRFADGFDNLAEEVLLRTGRLVGFFIDALPPRASEEFRPSPEQTGPQLYRTPAILGIQCFIPEIRLGGADDDERIERKRDFSRGWAETGIPFIMDISPGYDAHIVFPSLPYYGFTYNWVNAMTQMVEDFADGLVYNSWNGYTEGMVAVPTVEGGDFYYQWLRSFDLGIGPPY